MIKRLYPLSHRHDVVRSNNIVYLSYGIMMMMMINYYCCYLFSFLTSYTSLLLSSHDNTMMHDGNRFGIQLLFPSSTMFVTATEVVDVVVDTTKLNTDSNTCSFYPDGTFSGNCEQLKQFVHIGNNGELHIDSTKYTEKTIDNNNENIVMEQHYPNKYNKKFINDYDDSIHVSSNFMIPSENNQESPHQNPMNVITMRQYDNTGNDNELQQQQQDHINEVITNQQDNNNLLLSQQPDNNEENMNNEKQQQQEDNNEIHISEDDVDNHDEYDDDNNIEATNESQKSMLSYEDVINNLEIINGIYIFDSLSSYQKLLNLQQYNTTNNQLNLWVTLLYDNDCTSQYSISLIESMEYVANRMKILFTSQQKHQQLDIDDTANINQDNGNNIPIHFAKIILSKEETLLKDDDVVNDKNTLYHRFHILKTPTIVLVRFCGKKQKQSELNDDDETTSRDNITCSMPVPLIDEYKGITYQNKELMFQSIIRTYYYFSFLTTSQTVNIDMKPLSEKSEDDDNNQMTSTTNRTTTTTSDVRLRVTPKYFSSLNDIQSFLLDHANVLFIKQQTSNVQSFSFQLSVVERLYIEYIMGWNSYYHPEKDQQLHSKDEDDVIDDKMIHHVEFDSNITLFIQRRCLPTATNTVVDDENENNNHHLDDQIMFNSKSIYTTFNKMGGLLANRRDVLFLVVSDCFNGQYEDASIQVYQIPTSVDIDYTVSDWLTKFQTKSSYFTPSDYCSTSSSTATSGTASKLDDEEKRMNIMKSNTMMVHTRLHEFSIQITSPSIVWFDRETIAPIAFTGGRNVHAVLFINMHNVTLLDQLVQQEEYSDESYNDDEAKHLIRTILTYDYNVNQNRIAIQQFHNVCQAHKRSNHYNDCTTNEEECRFLLRDMVCMVIPSTETRILSTFGIDYWKPYDDATQIEIETSTRVPPPDIFPTLLITDQRSVGMKRYYLDDLSSSSIQTNDDDDNTEKDTNFENWYYTKMNSFVNDFWDGQLKVEVKSDPKPTSINKSGVRIISADTAHDELFHGDDNDSDDSDGGKDLIVKLILFVAPTCGHCKRTAAIWNQLAQFLKHIEWDSIVQLYRMDITKNDLENTFNITLNWIPDAFYIVPPKSTSSSKCHLLNNNTTTTRNGKNKYLIRYTHVGEHIDELFDGGDDGIGSVRSLTEILEWLVFDIFPDNQCSFEKDRLSRMYTALKERFRS